MSTFNLRDTKAGEGFEPLPEGLYTVVCEKAELTTTKNTGNPMIKATFKVLDQQHKNRLVWENFVLTSTGLWKVKSFLDAAGSKVAQGDAVTEQDIANAMKGVTVVAYLEPTVGENGKASNNIKNYRPVAQGATAPAAAKSSIMG